MNESHTPHTLSMTLQCSQDLRTGGSAGVCSSTCSRPSRMMKDATVCAKAMDTSEAGGSTVPWQHAMQDQPTSFHDFMLCPITSHLPLYQYHSISYHLVLPLSVFYQVPSGCHDPARYLKHKSHAKSQACSGICKFF